MHDPEFRNKLIPAAFAALATTVGLIELGAGAAVLETRALLIALIAGLLCLAAHCFRVFEFSTSVVASQFGLAMVASIQLALVGTTRVTEWIQYVSVGWMVLALPALHLGLVVHQSADARRGLYPVIAMLYGAAAPAGLVWFDDRNLAQIQFSAIVGLMAVAAAVLIPRLDREVSVETLDRHR